MIQRLKIAPEVFLILRSGCIKVIAHELPRDARIVDRGMDGPDFFLDIESEEFDMPGSVTAPVLTECVRCEETPA
jgi:hypothetical protein